MFIPRYWAESVAQAEEGGAKYAGCAYLKTVGRDAAHPEVAAVVQPHDTLSGAESGLPLA